MRALVLALVLLVGACATPVVPVAPAGPSGGALDAIARDYVALTLEIGEREPGYVDAYYGPKEWAEAAKAAPRSLPALVKEATALTARTNAVDPAELDPLSVRRGASWRC